MNLQLLSARGRSVSGPRRSRSSRSRPLVCEGLEERLVLSAAVVGHHLTTDMMAHYAPRPAPQVHTLAVAAHAAPAASHHSTAAPAKTIRSTAASTPTTLVTLDLKPLDVNLLGLEVKTREIRVTVAAQAGSGLLLGNLLTTVSGLLNLQGVNGALNNVLGNVVTLVNGASLSVNGVNTSGSVPTPAAATTPVLDLHVAPVNLNLLGAIVTTSPIDVSIIAHSGQGLLLGNVVTDLANLLNGQQNQKLSIDSINKALGDLLKELNQQLPGFVGPTTPAPSTLPAGSRQIVSLVVPPIDLNLLGLVLQTDRIQVNAGAQAGNGKLLGNLLNQVLNTLDATPQKLTTLNTNLNGILGKVVSVLNASALTLPTNALSSLSPALQNLALPNLVNTSTTPASAPVLNLNIAALPNDTRPPVDVNLLGLVVTTSDVHARLTATTGQGNILGNLVYNVSHLLDPGGPVGLLSILSGLGI